MDRATRPSGPPDPARPGGTPFSEARLNSRKRRRSFVPSLRDAEHAQRGYGSVFRRGVQNGHASASLVLRLRMCSPVASTKSSAGVTRAQSALHGQSGTMHPWRIQCAVSAPSTGARTASTGGLVGCVPRSQAPVWSHGSAKDHEIGAAPHGWRSELRSDPTVGFGTRLSGGIGSGAA